MMVLHHEGGLRHFVWQYRTPPKIIAHAAGYVENKTTLFFVDLTSTFRHIKIDVRVSRFLVFAVIVKTLPWEMAT